MNQIEESITMLNEIYQAASMGVQGSELLLNKSQDNQFKEKLHEYSNRYKDIQDEAATLLSNKGEVPRDAGNMEKMGLWMGVQMNTLKDKTSSHMAEMLIEGSTMGIIKSVKHKNTHPEADQQCYDLENKLLSLEQAHIDDMKNFLK